MSIEEKAYQSTPHNELIAQIMSEMTPKTEREHAAKREIQRLREAIEQAEEQRPHYTWQYAKDYIASRQAEKQEQVAFYVYKPTPPHGNLGRVVDGDLPWVYDQDPSSGFSARMLVYTAPPQRDDTPAKAVEWVGLTDEEAKKTFEKHNCTISADLAGILARAIKQAIKEKNT